MVGVKLNVVISGVGGQGLITLANIIAKASLKAGTPVVVAETHGLSQRGGTVIVHVRLGEVSAPLIPKGEGDLMLSMELIEALRYSDYLRGGATAIVNDYLLPPSLPDVQVPTRDEILKAMNGIKVVTVNATQRALELGNARVANIVLLGRALKEGVFEGFFGKEEVEEVLKEMWPKAYELNLKALNS
ncbi:indolepyruvate oxidoreductase [Ignicoccus pacificus DSM 13166]|uniref:Indolepyruvate oxidoreductase n=1 Tax=Ignicoccus pacificus DSM 13166 TaxID=940294 RepID=A0A977K945_9CREN|nr:indolepyruvate oxidoreductase [Ignicoccus pacificus DSM 13166]